MLYGVWADAAYEGGLALHCFCQWRVQVAPSIAPDAKPIQAQAYFSLRRIALSNRVGNSRIAALGENENIVIRDALS
jgi:hypothetical protein